MFPRIKRKRSKVRPGRLRGKALEQLRRDCFERDGYRCQATKSLFESWNFTVKCLRPVTWETGHMAHIRNKRMWGDTLDNVVTKCAECHIQIEHAYGPTRIKPCPAKEKTIWDGQSDTTKTGSVI
jgi:5-methylcytosine-specific restriction endonuclease McrA